MPTEFAGEETGANAAVKRRRELKSKLAVRTPRSRVEFARHPRLPMAGGTSKSGGILKTSGMHAASLNEQISIGSEM